MNPRALVGRTIRRIGDIAGRAYVPGAELADALRIARPLAAAGFSTTLGYFHNWRETPAQMVETLRSSIDALAALRPQGYVSVKAPGFRYAPEVVEAIADAARTQDIVAHFDSHEHVTTDATWECVRQCVEAGANTGLSIPGRWRRSPDDAAMAADLGLRVRVVKGEWADPGAPGLDPRAGFLKVIDTLAGRAREVAVASHDLALARTSLQRLQAAGTPCELELLNGLPRTRLIALGRELGVSIRLYVPYGASWRPYAISKALHNPKIFWWLARDSVLGALPSLRGRRP